MSSKDIYNKATVYNPPDTRTKAPEDRPSSSSSSQPTALASSGPSLSLAIPNQYTKLERDNHSSSRASSSRPSQQHTTLQRDGQSSSSRGHASVPQVYTLLNRDQQSSSSSRQPTVMRAAATTAPPDVQSRFKSQHDVEMASKQMRYQEMNREEKKKQDEWVHNFIQYAGPCPAGFSWERVKYGYVCNGGNHLCTDDLLAEGKGGFYNGTLDAGWWGPIYDQSVFAQMQFKEDKVWEHARKHGLDPYVAPVIPDPDLPATDEVHPGIAKARAGLGPMPQARSVEEVLSTFERVGQLERILSRHPIAMSAGLAHHLPQGPPNLGTRYAQRGPPNRLTMGMSNGSSHHGGHPTMSMGHGFLHQGGNSTMGMGHGFLHQGGYPPHGFGPPPHGSGYYGNGSHGQGPYGYHRH